MGNVHWGGGEIRLKGGVNRKEIVAEIKNARMPLWFEITGDVLEYSYETKWPDYEVFETLKKFAAEPWVNTEEDEYSEDDAPRKWTYSP